MKRHTSNHPGQKKLTQFFLKKPAQIEVNGVVAPQNSNGLHGKLIEGEEFNVSNKQNNSNIPLASISSNSTKKSSPKKHFQTLFELSPVKKECILIKSPSKNIEKSVLNGKRISPRKPSPKKRLLEIASNRKDKQNSSPHKKGDKNPEPKSLFAFNCNTSPNKICIDLVSKDEILEEPGVNLPVEENKPSPNLSLPKKRKCSESPSKEKLNDTEPASTDTAFSKTGNDGIECINNSLPWGDEVDFVNLGDDVILISPKKIQVKRQKCDEISSKSKCSLKLEKLKSPPKNKIISEHGLSQFIIKDAASDDKRSIKFDKLERYEVIEVLENSKEIRLTLKSLTEDITGVCLVRNPWNECAISVKDIVSVQAILKDEGWVVDWNGVLVLNPDRLISGTTIVGSVYCMRKSVLSHIFKESGGTKECMIIGSFVHELFQEALKQKLKLLNGIEELYQKKIRSSEFLLNLFVNNLNYEETVPQIHSYVGPIYKFIQLYVLGDASHRNSQNWDGQITEVEDIEENIWSPVLGIKGKVDATVEVRIHKKHKVMPLELKTGKVSFSVEHRGQVILYCMLLQQLQRNVDSGLLLYLNNGVEMKEIKCEERETRDLTQLRNGLSQWLSKLFLVEAKEVISPPTLPPPINRRTCSSCPYLVPCSAALSRSNELEKLSEGHRLKEFAPEAIKHLSSNHMNFVFHWLGLLSLEKSTTTTKLSDIWSISSDLREKSGKCLAHMKMHECVKDIDGGFKATFSKLDDSLLETEFTLGQLLIVSSKGHLALALGVVKSFSPISLTLMLDKSIKSDTPFFLDAYEGDSTFTIQSNNLSCLLEDSPRASRLRELIIDHSLPKFTTKLSSKIKKVGKDIFERLNKEQVRAVLQAIASEDYILIKGMPGAGKTTTMAALIELLTRMEKRVLVTSFTHSAIDNILINLVGKVKMLRLGPEHRIHPKLKEVTEHHYVKTLEEVTPAGIESIFTTKEVIGVTCYGCKHPWVERQMFDVCLVDEASQVSLPAILRPLSLSHKFILIGDPKQLPPLVLNEQAKELGLGKSLFEWLERPAVTSPLTLQYRMNKNIMLLANNLTYSGQLQSANESIANATLSIPKVLDETLPFWVKESLSPKLEKSVILLDIKCGASSETGENKPEASVVIKLTDALIKGGVPCESIGVIATYSRQVTLLKTLLKENVEVNTVDQYQGRDKDVIIYSTTRTFASVEKKDILSDWNRLTVAVTRAKRKLIILGNVDVLRPYDNFAKLLTSISDDNIIKVPLEDT